MVNFDSTHLAPWYVTGLGGAVALLLDVCVPAANALSFRPTSPVFYSVESYPYFNGNKEFNITFTELNPCRSWFSNLTNKADWNTRLVEMCNATFVSNTFHLLRNCKISTRERIIRQQFHLESNFVRSPHAAIMIRMHAVSTLGTIYSVQKSQETEANVMGLYADLRDYRNASLRAKTALMEMKSVVGELVNTDKRIIDQLKFMQQETESLKKVTYLINKYETYLNHVGDYLRDCNRKLAYHRLSPALMEYGTKPLWKEPASKWSEVKACSVRLNQESDMALNLQERVPEVEEGIKVLGADKETHLYCYANFFISHRYSCRSLLPEHGLY